MILPESYRPEWIDYVVRTHQANSYDLTEKMIYAFALVEQLRDKGLHFIFKGGTSLVLMLDSFHRLSKDIDILMDEKPGNLNTLFDQVVNDSPFLRWEKSERKNDEFSVPKEHYKFIYEQSRPGKYPEQPILLDIVYMPSTYPATQSRQVQSYFLQTEAPFQEVVTPTLNSIMGDKLTAFAPNTIGIPPGKNKAVEIAKQLFDLNKLFAYATDIGEVSDCFQKTALMVAKHYRKDLTPPQVCDDIIETSFIMASNGKENPDLFSEIKNGVSALPSYLSRTNVFGWNVAVLSAARVAYLAACIRTESDLAPVSMRLFDVNQLKEMKIDHKKYASLNKALKAGYAEAWLYWYHTAKLLSA